MSLLQGITSGVSSSGIRMVIAGVEKMGKTTLGCGAQTPLLIPMEVGFAGVNVSKTPIAQTYDGIVQFVGEVTAYAKAGQFPFRSLVFDSATALERLIHDHVLRLDPASKGATNKSVTMESCHGGFGKGYTMANTIFSDFLESLDVLAVFYGINIIFTAHVFSSRVSDPTVGEYDCWDLLLHSPKNQKTYGKREIMTQWADVVGFLYEPMFLISNDKSGTTRGISQNKGRVLGLSRTPAYVAGNRFGLVGEIAIPAPPAVGWNTFADLLYKTKGIDVFTR